MGIRYPDVGHTTLAGYVEVRDAAVVSSGGYENYFDYRGTRYHHILDPAISRPASTNVLGVSVIAANATDADVYATAVCVIRLQSGLDFLEQLPEVEGIIFDSNGGTHLTGGLQSRFFRL